MKLQLNKTTQTAEETLETLKDLYNLMGKITLKDMVGKYKIEVNIEKLK